MSKKLFIRGTLLLTFTGLLSRLIGFFYRIFLSHTIGAHGLGIFQLVLPLQLLILSVCASGIQTAISRLTASEITLGHSRRAGNYFLTGTVFSVSFSLIFSWLLYLFRFLGLSYSERTSDSFSDSSAFFQYSSEHFS